MPKMEMLIHLLVLSSATFSLAGIPRPTHPPVKWKGSPKDFTAFFSYRELHSGEPHYPAEKPWFFAQTEPINLFCDSPQPVQAHAMYKKANAEYKKAKGNAGIGNEKQQEALKNGTSAAYRVFFEETYYSQYEPVEKLKNYVINKIKECKGKNKAFVDIQDIQDYDKFYNGLGPEGFNKWPKYPNHYEDKQWAKEIVGPDSWRGSVKEVISRRECPCRSQKHAWKFVGYSHFGRDGKKEICQQNPTLGNPFWKFPQHVIEKELCQVGEANPGDIKLLKCYPSDEERSNFCCRPPGSICFLGERCCLPPNLSGKNKLEKIYESTEGKGIHPIREMPFCPVNNFNVGICRIDKCNKYVKKFNPKYEKKDYVNDKVFSNWIKKYLARNDALYKSWKKNAKNHLKRYEEHSKAFQKVFNPDKIGPYFGIDQITSLNSRLEKTTDRWDSAVKAAQAECMKTGNDTYCTKDESLKIPEAELGKAFDGTNKHLDYGICYGLYRKKGPKVPSWDGKGSPEYDKDEGDPFEAFGSKKRRKRDADNDDDDLPDYGQYDDYYEDPNETTTNLDFEGNVTEVSGYAPPELSSDDLNFLEENDFDFTKLDSYHIGDEPESGVSLEDFALPDDEEAGSADGSKDAGGGDDSAGSKLGKSNEEKNKGMMSMMMDNMEKMNKMGESMAKGMPMMNMMG